jgi:hypothetical protein
LLTRYNFHSEASNEAFSRTVVVLQVGGNSLLSQSVYLSPELDLWPQVVVVAPYPFQHPSLVEMEQKQEEAATPMVSALSNGRGSHHPRQHFCLYH